MYKHPASSQERLLQHRLPLTSGFCNHTLWGLSGELLGWQFKYLGSRKIVGSILHGLNIELGVQEKTGNLLQHILLITRKIIPYRPSFISLDTSHYFTFPNAKAIGVAHKGYSRPWSSIRMSLAKIPLDKLGA